MKKSLWILAAFLSVSQLTAEEGNWLTDLSKAQAKAKQENKLVLMDFNGSDWCPPCKALRKNVFESKAFMDYAKNNLVLVDVDFPHQKQQTEEVKRANEALSQKYKVEAFPTVIVLSGEGKELTKVEGYGGQSPEDFVATLKKLKKQT